MRIKTKLTLGLGLLFTLIIFLGGIGAVYIHFLKLDTRNILHDNYNSLLYAKSMLRVLDKSGDSRLIQFEVQLKKQEGNATEVGEKEMNVTLRAYFESYKQNGQKLEDLLQIREWLIEVMEVNMKAIEFKSELANKTAIQATIWIAIAGTACFVIALGLLINLPSNIADPIQKLTASIKQIASSNYKERVFLDKNDEFGELAQSFNTMAQKLEEYNSSHLAKLMRQKKRIEALINSMSDVVIGLDENMQVIFVNEEACKVLGLAEEEMIGKNSKDIAIYNDLMRMLLKDLNVGQVDKEPLKIIHNDKENYFDKQFLHIEITPTGEEHKELVGHVIILKNITEFKELDAAKTRFIATVSHEFKTPISSMKMSLQLLKNERIGALNEEQGTLIDSIQDDAGRLLKITSELLNLTQIESGKIMMNMKPVEVKQIVQYAVEANHIQAEQKAIKIEVALPENLQTINVDLEKTTWVLTNLIANAINYSHDSSVVEVCVGQDEKGTTIRVKDEGMGIPPEYLSKVFDRYFRVPGTHREGTGLGLAISKEIIEAQGGTVNVLSEYGVGSEFVLRF
ncbi:HAMP domain-containing protein [Myroides marinus]|uniref:sensor histidine kinase n=1 Tax=Myroides marinus TaxID=703342 RepID=UPI0025764D50|nr:ATP-binding protein [Myroides marinus]MDM1369583.1 HAMP domain-containing protein [Myroides marinus]MDM1376306.1 HAMP domain-containing protein [Myroides marinus]MDM1382100.1 HAMP domain-containing protein [Myroides marinus]MDM1391269.1 HAMP domain-containing protein [Myroides marinus]MDM1403255.1 HAMP domain-containing protein [Myroides marinus]